MKKAYYGLLTFAIMSLSYDLYYWNMRSAVGVLRAEDKDFVYQVEAFAFHNSFCCYKKHQK